MSAADREARENLVNSLVAGIAAAGGVNAATATGAAQVEVESNQVAPMASPPPWLAGFKLPGYNGETADKGDGVIVDNATELDASAKAGPLVTPLPDARTIGDWITAIIPDQVKGLVDYAVGTPLSLSATSGALACTQLIADTVASDDSAAIGTLGTATATLDLATRSLNNLSLPINLAGTQYALTNSQSPLNGISTTGQLSVQSVVVGHDATKPLVAVGYSATLPNKEGIGGVVVLQCQ